jgi:hypothetical protein
MTNDGQTVNTVLGDVDLSGDVTQESGDATQQPVGEAGTGSEGQQQAGAEQKIRVGDAEYTTAQLAQFIAELKNAKEMRRAADRAYKEAKRLSEDPEIVEQMRVRDTIRGNPQLAAQFRALQKWLAGKSTMPGDNGLAAIASRMQAFEQRFAELDNMRDLEAAKGSIDAFLEKHNAIPGAQQWTRETPEFVEFFEQFDEATQDGDVDIDAYFWKTEGPKLLSSIAESARTEGANKVAQTLRDGARASRNTTAPAGQRTVPPEIDPSSTNWNPEIEAALADTALLDQL